MPNAPECYLCLGPTFRDAVYSTVVQHVTATAAHGLSLSVIMTQGVARSLCDS